MTEPTKLEVPLPEDLARELHGFWEGIFGSPGDIRPEVFLGSETEHNSNIVYLRRRGQRLAGTCNTTTSKAVPALGGFGEVATDPEFRGAGIATELCRQAVEDFRATGGQALFLATGNGDAARIYHRLGWRRLARSNVMANITSGDSPEEFLVDYFRSIGPPITVGAATPAVRIPMIPLVVMPHDWQVLDANPVGMFSTRHRLQSSCMGQYPKYDAVVRDGRGAWFAAYAAGRQVVGMSTARLDGSGACQVDGFAHRRFADVLDDLVRAAMDWGAAKGATVISALLSVEDEAKRDMFESLDFREAGSGDEFELDDRSVASVRMEMT